MVKNSVQDPAPLLVPGRNLLKGNVELLLHGHSASIPGKVAHRQTQIWKYTAQRRECVYVYVGRGYLNNTCVCVCACVSVFICVTGVCICMCVCVCVLRYSLIILLLDDIGQLRTVLLDVVETNEQGVPLGTHQFSGRREILQLSSLLLLLIPGRWR